MFEKIFGKNNSIQRGLIVDFIIAIVLILFFSLIGFYVFVNNETLKTLVQINVHSEEEIKELLEISRRGLFILILNTILISAIMIKISSKKMLKPLKQINEATKKVASGDFSVRLETKRKDEISELVTNFNQMTKELGSIECLQKEFIDNVSHEIKTPISSIQGFAKLLEDPALTQDERNDYTQIIIDESNRLLNLSTNILKLSKLQNQEKITKQNEINLAEQIRKTIALLEPKWRKKNIVFDINLKEEVILGDEELTFQVWLNLLDNAIKFSNEGGIIKVSLTKKDDNIIVIIQDNGIGMEQDELEKIYTRFYQVDKSHLQEGSGLGLAIVKRIIELSKGDMIIESKKNEGTKITIKLKTNKSSNNIIIE